MDKMNSWIPFFSTIAGGAIALIGVIITAKINQKQTNIREKRKILLEKAEEIYKLILKLDHLTCFYSNCIIIDEGKSNNIPIEEVDLKQFEYNQIEMLVMLYFPEITKIAEQFNELRLKHSVLAHQILLFNDNNIPTSEDKESIKKLQIEYEHLSTALKSSISGVFK